jgi:2-polyprenyl-6-methoxyphenol hydroxylase-like FAD-dependent oxidoreductase
VTPDYTLNDMYESIVTATVVPMEEGPIATKWNYGRAVLIGDAVHKATANLGMGGNLCVDDACRLSNGLYALLERNKEPTTAELTKIFDGYEKAQRPRADFVRRASGIFAGYETMSRWYSPLVRLIFPWIPSAVKMRVFSGFDRSAPVLGFLPAPGN